MTIKKTILTIGLLGLLLLMLGQCGNHQKNERDEIILAKVGDKTVSLNEFIARAEYTIRPNYCKGSDNISKKRILNSLIAEKMFALEEGDTNRLLQNKRFQRYIEGRKQQAMRQWLYHMEAVEKVKLDSSEIKRQYQLAGRKYRVNYFNINDDTLASTIRSILKEDRNLFNSIFFELSGSDSIPQKEVDYFVRENDVIQNALYSEKLKVGDVIGPLRLEDGQYIVLKIDGWTTTHIISETGMTQRWNDVKDDLTNQKARKIYENFITNLMKNKRMDLNPETFGKLADVFGAQYFTIRDKEKEHFLNQAFDKEIDGFSPDFGEEIDDIIDKPFLMISGETWTVRDFSQELDIHPLVFRKRNISRSEFPEQLKFAIADLIRDKYLAKEAYKKGYDKAKVVARNIMMWQDASVALYHKTQYLQTCDTNESNSLQLIDQYLNPYIDTLQEKYSSDIEVNVEEFDKINLTRTDMFVTQSNVPYPVLVPAFPQLTTDHKLDYGKRMDNHNIK